MELTGDFTLYAIIWIVGCVVIAAGIVARDGGCTEIARQVARYIEHYGGK